MVHKVRLNKHDLAYFRRLALDSEKEIEAYLIGSTSPDVTTVAEFVYPKKYADQKPNSVSWSDEDVERAHKRADELNKRIIGSIHSHPSYMPVCSATDMKGHVKVGFRVLGICGTNPEKRKTEVKFWVMESALPCKIVYV